MATSKDPVCGMNVQSDQARYKAEHHGKNYTFCSQQCLEKFKKHPDHFNKSKG